MSLITPAGPALPYYCRAADQIQCPEITAAISVPLFFIRRSFVARQHGEPSCCGVIAHHSPSPKLKQISSVRYRRAAESRCCQCYYVMNRIGEVR